MSTYESDLPRLKTFVLNSDRVIDNTTLLSLRTSCENNNVKNQKGIGQYDELIQMIDEKLGRDTK